MPLISYAMQASATVWAAHPKKDLAVLTKIKVSMASSELFR